MLQSSHSRGIETAADIHSADLMQKVGGNGRAVASILARIGDTTEPDMKILRDRPDTRARVAVTERLAHGTAGQAMLPPAEWSALRGVCKG